MVDEGSLSHLDASGSASMVDVSAKPAVAREAVASGFVKLSSEVLELISSGGMPKGDVFAVARIAGIGAAKKTQELIPLCHQIPLSKAGVDFEVRDGGVAIKAVAKTIAPTGVEMEALTAASVAALTIYDMCKAVDKGIEIAEVKLLSKTKGEG